MRKIILFILLSCSVCFAQEQIIDYSDNSLPILNEELRKLEKSAMVVEDLSTSDVTGTLPIANGGTGQITAQLALNALIGSSTQGDILYYNGTNWVKLGYGTSGYLLKTQGAGANPAWTAPGTYYADARYKVLNFTRDMTANSGDVAYTGVGFTPKAAVFFGSVVDLVSYNGFDDATTRGCIFYSSLAGMLNTTSASIYLKETSGNVYQYAIVKTFDSDGFTLTWTKAGTPTAGTANLTALVYR